MLWEGFCTNVSPTQRVFIQICKLVGAGVSSWSGVNEPCLVQGSFTNLYASDFKRKEDSPESLMQSVRFRNQEKE